MRYSLSTTSLEDTYIYSTTARYRQGLSCIDHSIEGSEKFIYVSPIHGNNDDFCIFLYNDPHFFPS